MKAAGSGIWVKNCNQAWLCGENGWVQTDQMEASPELVGMGMDENHVRAWQVFQPYGTQKMIDLIRSQRRLVHYTSAEVALSILKEGEVWMRSSTTMNDFSELEYGTGLLTTVFGSPIGKRFRDLIDGLFPYCTQKTAQQFDDWMPQFRVDTFLTCLSEHLPEEDELGRLSMWRAYGGGSGVALVMPGWVKSLALALAATITLANAVRRSLVSFLSSPLRPWMLTSSKPGRTQCSWL